MGYIRRAKKSKRVSRFFKYVFEHEGIKKLLGANIALAIFATSLFPTNVFADIEPEQTVIVENETPLTTIRVVQYPLGKIRVTQGYQFFHPGLDLDGITGDPVRPVMAGKVEAVSHSKFAYGHAIIINHGEGVSSLYAHLSRIYVAQGDTVTTDSIVGEVGATGRSFGDHLHLEIYKDGHPVNPYTILPPAY